MLQEEHSAILSTFIKLPSVIKIFVLSIFEWPLKTGFTVDLKCFSCSENRAMGIHSLHAGYFFMLLLSSADFSKLTFSKNSFRNTIKVSKGLDPDQNRHSVCTFCRL